MLHEPAGVTYFSEGHQRCVQHTLSGHLPATGNIPGDVGLGHQAEGMFSLSAHPALRKESTMGLSQNGRMSSCISLRTEHLPELFKILLYVGDWWNSSSLSPIYVFLNMDLAVLVLYFRLESRATQPLCSSNHWPSGDPPGPVSFKHSHHFRAWFWC